MTREDKSFIRKLQNTAKSELIHIKYRKINNNWFYWAMSPDNKVLFYIKRTCDVSSGRPVFSYVVKDKTRKTTNPEIGAAIFPVLEAEYHRNWLSQKRHIIAGQQSKVYA